MTSPNEHGGYRPPASPAPVSGPGALSRRTDGKQPIHTLPDAAYGEQATFRDVQRGAPMAEAGSVGGPTVSPLDMSRVVPFGADTQRPGEPVTAGANAGAGPSADSLGPTQSDQSWLYMKSMLPALEIAANQPNSSVELRQMVRRLRGS